MGPEVVAPGLLPQLPHTLTAARVASELGVDPTVGLTDADVERQRRRYGRNLLAARKPVSDATLLVRQFVSPVVALLAAAMTVSFVFGEWQQAIAIVVVLLVNAAIGYGTERRAVRSMEALRALGGRNARVRRNARSAVVNAHELVPGDVVLLEAGDVVPADLRCAHSSVLGVDESALTGESVPVGKRVEPDAAEAALHERAAMLFKGTHVVRGSGEGIVVGTGLATELGRITQLVDEADVGNSPLEDQLERLARQLIWLTLMLASAVAVAGLVTGRPVLLMVETSIALAIAAIPEGLPIVATLALGRGMLRMARHNALVERLSAVETLGSTTVVLTDKTGTLTENTMAVERVVTTTGAFFFDYQNRAVLTGGVSVDPSADSELERALLTGVLCGNADYDSETASGTGDPMEVALLRAGALAGLTRAEQLNLYPEVAEYPFDPATKWMATVHRDRDRYFVAIKGAPEEILTLTNRIGTMAEPLDDDDKAKWLDTAQELAADGLRVLALATHQCTEPQDPLAGGLALVGLVALRDPARADIADAVASLRSAGISVAMATGDHPSTALAIAHDVGIAAADATVTTGSELSGLKDASESTRKGVARQRVFARVDPEHKLDLIELFQSQGEVVAMIGDGVNDAPALSKADIGVAMGKRGTEVAREAADIVLLDDRFSTIVTAAREGRVIFDNIRRFSMYLLSCNIAEVLVVALAVFTGLPLPLLPLQILFLNLVTDVFPAFALASGEGDGDVLDRPPRRRGEPIIRPRLWRAMTCYGLAISASTLLSIVVAMHWLGFDAAATTTVSFLTIALAQLWHVFNMRGRGTGVLRNAVTTNRLVWGALALCLGLIVVAATVPVLATALQIEAIGARGWGLVLVCSLLPLAAGQLWLTAGRASAGARR
ncbi:cation-translocating P-type ATPase [Mycolicibacterium stellerae]|uniref:cation-translocating P-type ATPase n=1 Tax=Mycolicibacterium stellerae TaxID=2358193 RepID=UPI000F0BB072|nr:cation-transporting P-type ATPase [Mycolicibacterium stellerae]